MLTRIESTPESSYSHITRALVLAAQRAIIEFDGIPRNVPRSYVRDDVVRRLTTAVHNAQRRHTEVK